MRPALSDYEHLASGKVRELYRIDDETLLFVATDRISAYDYILDSEIPDKGRILTAMSVFFFDYVEAPNHLAGPPDDDRIPQEVLGRALVDVGENVLLVVRHDGRLQVAGRDLLATDDARDLGLLPLHLLEPKLKARPLGRSGGVGADGLVDGRKWAEQSW